MSSPPPAAAGADDIVRQLQLAGLLARDFLLGFRYERLIVSYYADALSAFDLHALLIFVTQREPPPHFLDEYFACFSLMAAGI